MGYKNKPATESGASEVFVVMDGNKVGGIYCWRDDANTHAQVVGGSVVVQQVKYEIPGWVKTMADSAKEKARLQGGSTFAGKPLY